VLAIQWLRDVERMEEQVQTCPIPQPTSTSLYDDPRWIQDVASMAARLNESLGDGREYENANKQKDEFSNSDE